MAVAWGSGRIVSLLNFSLCKTMPSFVSRSYSQACLIFPGATQGWNSFWDHRYLHFSGRLLDNGHPLRKYLPLNLSQRQGREPLSSYYHVKARLLASLSSQQGSSGNQMQGSSEENRSNIDLDTIELPGNVFSEYKCLILLKECIKCKSLVQARRSYTYIMLLTLEPAIVLQEHLVLALAKLGALDDALFVFNRLLRRTAFSWTALISGFADHDQAYGAINMYQHMLQEGVEPDRFTFIGLLKAYGIIGDLKQGKELHLEAQRMDFASNTFVSNTLISMYGKCGGVAEAEDVFYGITIHSVVSWTAMLAVYVENNQADKGLLLFRQMQKEGVSPNDQTFVGAIQACGILAEMEDACNVDGKATKVMSLELGQALHVEAWRAGFFSDSYVVTTLVNMYGKCRAVTEAEAAFSTLAKHNVASWTAMISAYVENGKGENALLVYRQMQDEGVFPNEHTLVCALQACDALTGSDGSVGQAKKARSWEIGQALHADAYTRSFASGEFLGNALVSMYGRHGIIKEAEHVFAGLNQRSVISWTAMLSAYVEQGKPERALQTYKRMHEEGSYPNEQTLVVAIQACGTLAESDETCPATHQQSFVSICLKICQSLHEDAERTGLASDAFVGSALLSMYAKCGAFAQAQEVFCTLQGYDTGSWNAMLSAYVEHDRGEMALHLYRHMLEEKVTLDNITLMNVLQACNEVCILQICREVHFMVVSSTHDCNVLLASSQIHTYGSCSSMPDAEATLVGIPQPDSVSWNACIASHAEGGNCEISSHILEAMLLASMRPDGVTFASLLSACNHAGLVQEGTEYFECMHEDHGLNQDFKHFAGIIDLLGRAGDFKRLENVLWRLPKHPDIAIWLSLLGSCHKHSNTELGSLALLNVLRLQSKMVLAFDHMTSAHIGLEG